MSTPLIPQEIYLLERYTSLESLEQARDAWRAMLDHAQTLLDRFMLQLPPDYRNRPLPEQPDIVWGETVLPNFRNTMLGLENACIRRANGDYMGLYRGFGVSGDSRPLPEQPDIVWGERVLPNFRNTMGYLEDACIKRAQGDYEALDRVVGVSGGIRGQGEFWSGWMNEVEPGAEHKYYDLLHRAGQLARPIDITTDGIWSPGDLTTRYHEILSTLPLNPPRAGRCITSIRKSKSRAESARQ